MSTKLEQLTQKLCDLVGNQVAMRNKAESLMEDMLRNAGKIATLQIAIADEQALIHLQQMDQDLRERMRAMDPIEVAEAVAHEHAATGEQPDLAMFSGTPICVECRKGRRLDTNGRCSECAGMVAGVAG